MQQRQSSQRTELDLRLLVRALLSFGFVFTLQIGHVFEHIAKTLTGQGLLGAQADSEVSHLFFNSLILVLSLRLVYVYPRNFWVYPLAVVCAFHAVEHVYIFEQYLRTGEVNGPGLLGQGGAFGLFPIERLDLHNIYNGVELILMALGFQHEFHQQLA
jgi:hypothetical protein